MVNKSKMLSMGTADVVLKLLPSEMPVVQFKLLGALRMLIDTQGKYVGARAPAVWSDASESRP